jgi:hypothetical protein
MEDKDIVQPIKEGVNNYSLACHANGSVTITLIGGRSLTLPLGVISALMQFLDREDVRARTNDFLDALERPATPEWIARHQPEEWEEREAASITRRYCYTIDFNEPALDPLLSDDERNVILNQYAQAIFEAAERLEALLSQSDWANPIVALGITTTGSLSH